MVRGNSWVWALLVLGLSGACWKPPRVGPQVKAAAPSTFKHETHLQLKEKLFCDACHPADPQKQYALSRPGSDAHRPCTNCHAEAFKQEPGPLCGVCHQSVNPKKKGASPLSTYPAPHRGKQLVRPFNHKHHLDAANEETALQCGACHVLEEGGSPYMAFPGHEACGVCHGKAQGAAEPHMKDCSTCHSKQSLETARNFLQNDIRFTHAKHQKTAGGQPIECLTCHEGVPESEVASNLPLPEMKDCATCHEDAARTPSSVRIAKCEVCHLDHVDAIPVPDSHTAEREPATEGWSEPMLASLAPALALPLDRSLSMQVEQHQRVEVEVAPPEVDEVRPLAPRRRPEDHTAMFRVRHGPAAASENAKCRYCHVGVSGSPVSSCQDCHAVMRPRSHTARFRGVRHGRLAAVDQKACATCHEVDYCTGCHNIAPPSHFPLSRFRTKHSRRASANTRSCLTCHTGEATCFRCHQPGVQ